MADSILSHQKSPSSSVRAAIYARVSTVNNGQSPEMQTRELREYCERRGWNVAAEFVDLGISGSKERRPQLDRLMAEARRRKFDVVVVCDSTASLVASGTCSALSMNSRPSGLISSR